MIVYCGHCSYSYFYSRQCMDTWNSLSHNIVGTVLQGPLYRENLSRPRPDIKNCAKRHIRPLYVNFGCRDIFFVFCLVPSVAQLSSASFCIVEVNNFWFGLFPSVAQLKSEFHYFLVFLRYSRYCH